MSRSSRSPSSPHILLITTDQQSATMLSCTGNPHLRTPHLDRLVAQGVRFEAAYAAQPLCIPQRCSWYTGLMPHQHGVTFNVENIPLNPPLMLGQLFRDAGYDTGYAGKWHINLPVKDHERHGFVWMDNLRSNGADVGMAAAFTRFLDQRGDRPFLFSASFNNPHNICEAARGGPFPDGQPGLFERLEELPPLPENFAIPVNEPAVIRQIQRRYQRNNFPVANWDSLRWRIHRWFYARLCEQVDRHIGSLLTILQERGLADQTQILFTSDHGEGNAHHQWNQKQILYEESVRVPFLLCGPLCPQVEGAEGRQESLAGKGKRGQLAGRVDTESLVNTGIDLIPTLCGLVGIPCPASLAGLDWSPALCGKTRGEALPTRDHLVIETEFGTYGEPAGVMGRAVRSGRYKYMVYSQGENPEFLADLHNDPGETMNRASDPAYCAILAEHRTALRTWIQREGDRFPLALVPVGTA